MLGTKKRAADALAPTGSLKFGFMTQPNDHPIWGLGTIAAVSGLWYHVDSK